MNSIIINLFGGPGTGKSTLCATIFSKLKMMGIETEMAPEYVKTLVWDESFKKIENQLYIFGKQHNTIHRLKNKVRVIITDSTLINSIIYYMGDNPHFESLVMWEHNKMNNINFFLERSFDYVENGRYQTLIEARAIDQKYKDFLEKNKVEYTEITSPYNIDLIAEKVLEKIDIAPF